MKNIVIIGGGFAGVWAALGAAHETQNENGRIGITLLSKDEYLTMRPRLYEKNPESLRIPLESTLGPVGVSFLQGAADEIDTEKRTVTFISSEGDQGTLNYDRLILAIGSTQKELPIPIEDNCAWDIDSFDSAVALDRHLANVMKNPVTQGDKTFVIIGAGFTGVELATEMRSRLSEYGSPEAAAEARIILVDQADVVGPELGANPRPAIEKALQRANIETRLGMRASRIEPHGVTLDNGAYIEAATTIITAGLTASALPKNFPADPDELGRLPVDEMLRVKGVPGVYAAGDIARAFVDGANLALMSCQHASPMGKFAGYNAARELLELPLRPYHQPDYVTCLDLGDSGAIFTIGWDRKIVMEGEEGKQMKQKINQQWIYPPQEDRESILAAAHIDAGPAS